MLQKIIVVIVGLVMSVVGALSPDLFAGKNAGTPEDEFAANTAEETLSTLRTSDGQAFARISVLWVEVDGRRVTEDAWGTGEVDEMRFKVGVKAVDDVALAVGDKIVPLHPTDIITVRMFRGDFSYRGLDTPLASVQLQGTVKTTVLKEGELGNRVLTRVGDIDLRDGAPSNPGDEAKVAYVVLTTGTKVDTVSVEDGGGRIFTEEVATAAEAKDEPGNLLAKWVKIDGKLIREYTWGDGSLSKVEFEPAEGASRSIVLAFNGETYEVPANERVVVDDFVGEYLIYQVSGGMMRVRLDGYARAYISAPAIPLPSQGGVGAPLVSFDYAPPSPKTTDTIQFRDHTTDDGMIVFRQWDFGDNVSGVLKDPTHRYARPGTYEVRLTVTDNDLRSSNMTRTVIVRNAEPVADFDFSPKIVNTDTVVAFTDHSYDPDGTLTNWTWDFGDGGSAFTRHPTHRFTRAGNITVTLSVSDELSGRSSLSKVILVRNSPPLAAFTYSGTQSTLEPIQFLDNSTDRDGTVVAWNWSFGDGRFGSGSAPVHSYARPGLFVVSLTAYDDMGDADTASTTILIGNRAPFAEFTWSPEGAPASTPITFTSQSSDPDGQILFQRWSFGDGTAQTSGPIVTHTFPHQGEFNVTLTVTDNLLSVSSVTRSVAVANSAPRASMIFAPSPSYRNVEVVFSDTSTDPDGDAITNSTWSFGDGEFGYGRVARHTYATVGTFDVTLSVTDDGGRTASITREERVINRPPVISATYGPRPVRAGDTVSFNGTGSDPDVPGGPVVFYWNYSDGVSLIGPTVTRTFPVRGDHTVSVRGIDAEGGVSPPVTFGFRVEFALPVVNFTWSPAIPIKDQLVSFSDSSFSVNGPIREWAWTFGDASGVATVPNPSHVYTVNGPFLVRLEATDITGQTSSVTKELLVNIAPHAVFTTTSNAFQLNTPIPFTDDSFDDDGTVDNWSWDFGDGTTSFLRHPTHDGYATSGTYDVVLTVRDNLGSEDSATASIDIANTAPIADWTRDPPGDPLVVNQSIMFYGYDLSYDPDANPIQSWAWNFGDGTGAVFGPNASHAFGTSGVKTVGLTVTDGSAKPSVRTPLSHRDLTIRPDHPITFIVTGRLPDGTIAPISVAPYGLTVRINGETLDAGAISGMGSSVQALVDPSLWVANDLVSLRITAPFLSGSNEQSMRVYDHHHVVYVNFTLRLAVLAAIVPGPGETVSPLAIFGADADYDGAALYSDMTERPHGTGTVMYSDGTAAGAQRVDIETRWIPLRQLSSLRNSTGSPETGSLLPNWCKAASVTSASNGSYDWAFDGASQCYLNGVPNGEDEGGIYPVGRWEVRARPQVATAENRLSPVRVFYVDPTGGLLLKASIGLA